MKKRSMVLWTYALAILLGIALYLTSERVQRAERTYTDIQSKLQTEAEAVHILKTEWTYLNRPDRLEDLATSHLKLMPIKPALMLTSVDGIPNAPKQKESPVSPMIPTPTAGSVSTMARISTVGPSLTELDHTIPNNALNTIAPASGETAPSPHDPLNKPAPIIAVDRPDKPDPRAMIPATFTPSPKTPVPAKKQIAKRANTSPVGVTFYQYMNHATSVSDPAPSPRPRTARATPILDGPGGQHPSWMDQREATHD